jgi:hypothetical protein
LERISNNKFKSSPQEKSAAVIAIFPEYFNKENMDKLLTQGNVPVHQPILDLNSTRKLLY